MTSGRFPMNLLLAVCLLLAVLPSVPQAHVGSHAPVLGPADLPFSSPASSFGGGPGIDEPGGAELTECAACAVPERRAAPPAGAVRDDSARNRRATAERSGRVARRLVHGPAEPRAPPGLVATPLF